jgi:hypothetical protein
MRLESTRPISRALSDLEQALRGRQGFLRKPSRPSSVTSVVNNDLILLQGRPEGAPPGRHPVHTFNLLNNPYLSYSAKDPWNFDICAISLPWPRI